MFNRNRVELIGCIGKNPQTSTVGNQALCKFSVATSERWTDTAGNKQERTEWHQVECWGKTAENVAQYLTKGSYVLVEGSLRTFKTKEGVDVWNIRAQRVSFLDRKPKGRVPGEDDDAGEDGADDQS